MYLRSLLFVALLSASIVVAVPTEIGGDGYGGGAYGGVTSTGEGECGGGDN